jgi:hypothetical protein
LETVVDPTLGDPLVENGLDGLVGDGGDFDDFVFDGHGAP